MYMCRYIYVYMYTRVYVLSACVCACCVYMLHLTTGWTWGREVVAASPRMGYWIWQLLNRCSPIHEP